VVILLCSSSLADYLYILIFFPTRRSSDLWLRERPSKERGPDQRLSDEGDVAVSATDDHDVVELVERLVGVSAREIGRPRAGLHLEPEGAEHLVDELVGGRFPGRAAQGEPLRRRAADGAVVHERAIGQHEGDHEAAL